MKINKIDSLNTNTKRTRSNFPRTNQDLTSFGAAERGAASPIHSKKAAEAIKSKFLSGISFKGHTEFVKHEKIGTSGYYFLSEDPNNVYSGSKDSHSMRLLIGARPSSHADSSIEETRARNGYTTNRVYFADPEEAVNEQTKKDHDFIVYDNRPHYPRPEQVRENYKMPGKNAVNYGQNFKTIAEYYVRREKADRKELEKLKGELKAFMPEYEQSVNYKKMLDEKEELFPWEVKDVTSDREKSDYYYDLNTKKYNDLTQKIGFYQERIEDSRVQQKKAIEAFKIFDEVGLIMMDRDNARFQIMQRIHNEIKPAKIIIARAEKSIESLLEQQNAADENLKAAKQWKALQMKNLSRNQARLQKLEQETEWATPYDRGLRNEEIKNLKTEIKSLDEEIKGLDKKILNSADRLIKTEEELANNRQVIESEKFRIAKNESEIPEFQRKLSEKSREVDGYWPKMEEFYRNNIEEWQY